MPDTEIDNSQEIDLIELFKKIWSKRRTVIKWGLIGAAVGIIVGFSIPAEYTSQVKLAPERNSKNMSSSMSGLAALAGVNLGSSSTGGINLQVYPDIVNSTSFIGELSQVSVVSNGKEMKLYDYVHDDLRRPWWNSVIALPFKAIGGIVSIFKKKQDEEAVQFDIYNLSREQYEVLKAIRSRVSINVDSKTNIISMSAKMQDPKIAAAVADSLSENLQRHVVNYQTDKAKTDLEFTESLYSDAQAAYYQAQEQYAEYMDNSQNTIRESIKAKQERYRNEQTLAFSVYSQLAQQLETAKINLQDKTPVATVIEPAIVPVMKSNMGKSTLLILWTFLGVIAAVAVIVIREFFPKKE